MWIKDRIDTEFKKHKDLDWSRLAEAKILSTLNDKVEKLKEEFEQIDIIDSCITDRIIDKIMSFGTTKVSIKQDRDIQTAKRCLNFKGCYCENKDCLNEACPLNSIYNQNLGNTKLPSRGLNCSPEVIKGMKSALDDVKHGRYHVLTKGEELPVTNCPLNSIYNQDNSPQDKTSSDDGYTENVSVSHGNKTEDTYAKEPEFMWERALREAKELPVTNCPLNKEVRK